MTPPVGSLLAGGLQPRVSVDVDTPLQAHALTLNDGNNTIAIAALDIIALPGRDADAVKRAVADNVGISPENILIACSHTHEAPYPDPLLGRVARRDEPFMARVRAAAVDAITRAAQSCQPAEIGIGSGTVAGICGNRRLLKQDDDVVNAWLLPTDQRDSLKSDGPVDEELVAVAVRCVSDCKPLAVLWNFTLHAHAFGGNHISADYPYHVQQRVAESLGADVVGVFTAGACGDINRFHWTDPHDVAERLAGHIVQTWQASVFTGDVQVAAETRPVELALRGFSAFQELEIQRKWPSGLEVFREEWELLRDQNATSVQTVLQTLRIGDLAVAAVPGEYFCALGLDIKERSPFPRTVVAELANDYVGYIPTRSAFAHGGYETFNARSSKVAAGEGERIANVCVEMLRQLA